MKTRILYDRLQNSPKSLLLLGPRQVGKSTLCKELQPDLFVNLASQRVFQEHLKDPGLIERLVAALPAHQLILIDEIQRIPQILNTVQGIIDQSSHRFLLSGSSARKLKRGKANLLPGRVLVEHLSPFVYQEIADQFDLQKALTIGTLPEVYLHDYGPQLLESYVDTYLREEVQAEALTKDLGAYARFLDMAASVSGQFLNYSKIASDTDIHKETIRRYFEILADTLLIERLPSYTDVPKERKARQKEKFIFFDLGVRNAILKRVGGGFSQEEMGQLFEQWIQLQCIYLNRCNRLQKKLSTFRDARGLEVDLIIESEQDLLLVEVKWSTKVKEKYFSNLHSLEKIISANNALTQNVKKIVVYRGEHKQKFSGDAFAVPYRNFLEEFTAKSGF